MNYPIVFVPGFLGSMGGDIVPGTGDFSFGLAEYAYKHVIKNLESMGYVLGEDLFIAFYDWRQKNQDSAKEYLMPTIEKAKQTSSTKKVNLICHSMGGLVARSYIQSNKYKYDVDKLIMIGTPNAGSVKAYFFWEGGQIPYDRVNNIFLKLLWEGFIWIFKNIYGMDDDLSTLRKMFPSVKQLLPSYEYNDYLYTKNKSNFLEFIPISLMKEKNNFLNNLNRNSFLIYKRGVKVHLIAGRGSETAKYLYVEKRNNIYWYDGEPKYVVTTYKGDGTVVSKSCGSIYGNINYIQGDHTDILQKSRYILGNILKKKILPLRYKENEIISGKASMILAKGVKDIKININTRTYSINSIGIKDISNDKMIIQKIAEDCFWILIEKDYNKKMSLDFLPLKGVESNILIIKSNKYDRIERRREISTSTKYTMQIK